MKKLLLFLLLIVSASSIQAQDVIVKKDGSTIICRVVEVNSSEIVYKKWTDLNGSNYVMNRADASAINYQSGKKVSLGEMTNLYAPNNQNTGAQMVNDKALLAMETTTNKILSKPKKLRLTGLIGGAVIIGVGGTILINGTTKHAEEQDKLVMTGGIIMACGALWGTTFCVMAHNYQKQISRLQVASVYQYKHKFANGSSFTTGVDVLKDRMLNNQAIGLGLSYNF